VTTDTLIPNSFLMWVKLFKYVDVIPQMGMLIQVLERAGMPVLIFSTVGLIPVVGMAFAYHAAFGQALPNVSPQAIRCRHKTLRRLIDLLSWCSLTDCL